MFPRSSSGATAVHASPSLWGFILRAPTAAASSSCSLQCPNSPREVSAGGEMGWLSSGAAPSPSKQPGNGRRRTGPTQVPKLAAQAMAVDGGWSAWNIRGGVLQLPALPSLQIKSITTNPTDLKGTEKALATLCRGTELVKNQECPLAMISPEEPSGPQEMNDPLWQHSLSPFHLNPLLTLFPGSGYFPGP